MFKTAKETTKLANNESTTSMINSGELGGQARAAGLPPQNVSCNLVAKYTSSSVVVSRVDVP